ncbi:MAG TPA: ABC transporter substrate-binding protein [Candidatus Dormibacteraeota bacterium]|nr:ABC transporter substrate-binding protein [Candidatus Dormibacteraeota bacterium]
MTGRTGPRRLLTAAAAAVLVAACGSSTSSSGGGGSGNIKTDGSGHVSYGVLSCFTGTLAVLGQAMLQGSQVAQKVINDNGGVLGKQLDLSHADTQCDEADAVPAVRQLLASNSASGIIGPETQEIAAVSPIVSAAKIPTEFQGGSTAFDKNTNPYLWRDSPSDSQLGVAMALYANKKGYKTGALLFSSDIAQQTIPKPIKATWQKLGNSIVADVTVAPGQTSYRTQVQNIINAHPDVVFTQLDPQTAAVMFQNFKELNNLAIPIVGTDVTSGDDYLKAITYPIAHDHLISVFGTNATGAAADNFAKAFAAQNGATAQPIAGANYAYDAVISLALAMDKAGTTDGPAVIAAMKMVTNPPGQACDAYADCLKGIQAGTKIKMDGASGDLIYNQYQNVFGPYGAFQADATTGAETQVQLLSASDLAAATP